MTNMRYALGGLLGEVAGRVGGNDQNNIIINCKEIGQNKR